MRLRGCRIRCCAVTCPLNTCGRSPLSRPSLLRKSFGFCAKMPAVLVWLVSGDERAETEPMRPVDFDRV